jgi:hypothetical protein
MVGHWAYASVRTCIKMGMIVGQVLKLVRKDGIGLLRSPPPRYVHEVLRMRNRDWPHPAHLAIAHAVGLTYAASDV